MSTIDEAFAAIRRQHFLPTNVSSLAERDQPLPIGFNQTNSQPSTVRAMLTWLQPNKGQRILDVGSGSGWTTALLGHIVGSNGHVFAVERIPELLKIGQSNCRKVGITNATFFEANETYGLPAHAPYDGILVSASAPSIPPELIEQLHVGGKLVIPVASQILELQKTGLQKTKVKKHSGFSFVPLLPTTKHTSKD